VWARLGPKAPGFVRSVERGGGGRGGRGGGVWRQVGRTCQYPAAGSTGDPHSDMHSEEYVAAYRASHWGTLQGALGNLWLALPQVRGTGWL